MNNAKREHGPQRPFHARRIVNAASFKAFFLVAGLGCFLISCSGSIRVSSSNAHLDWSEMGGGNLHDNVRKGDSYNVPEFLFRLKPNSMVGTSTVIGDNTVFCGTLKGVMQAYDLDKGNRIGKIKVKYSMISAPVYDNGVLYFAAVDGKYTINGYDTERGKFIWRKNLGIFESPLTIKGDNLFAASRSGTVYCIDKRTGDEVWSYQADSEILSGMIALETVIVAGTLDGVITALDLDSGEPVWHYATGMSLRATPSSDGTRLFWGTLDNTLLTIDSRTGEEIWRYSTAGSLFTTPSVVNGSLIFGSNDGNVYSIAISDGKEQWRFNANTVVNTSCIAVGDKVYFGTLGKKIYGLDILSGKKIWEYDVEGRVVANPSFYDGKLIFPVEPKYLYVFGLTK